MKVHLFLMLGLTLAGCVPAMPGDSISSNRPFPPIAAPVPMYAGDQPAQPPKTETHGSVNSAGCKAMEKRFKEAGRRIKLIDTRRNPYNGTLRYLCIFQGEDAQQGYFQDARFPGDNY